MVGVLVEGDAVADVVCSSCEGVESTTVGILGGHRDANAFAGDGHRDRLMIGAARNANVDGDGVGIGFEVIAGANAS